MDANAAAAVALIGALAGAFGSVARQWLVRPKTKAEADNLNAAATVSVSSDNREWAQLFERRADAAEKRADQAEHRADEAETKADSVEANLIRCYGYVRSLRDEIRRLNGTPPPPPPELEALWRGSLGGGVE